MKKQIIKKFIKNCVGDTVEYIFIFSFISLVFAFLLWVSSFLGEPSIPMVILVTSIIFIFGANPMKVDHIGKRLNALTRHYIDILFS